MEEKKVVMIGGYRLKDEREKVSAPNSNSLFLHRSQPLSTTPSPTSAGVTTGLASTQTPHLSRAAPQVKTPTPSSSPATLAPSVKRASETCPSSTLTSSAAARSEADTSTAFPAAKRVKSTSTAPLAGVVFVLSGFQNPLRSQLREVGLKLGASYKNDWDSSCTHLVCAIAGTPKYNLVKAAGGIIVDSRWLGACDTGSRRVDEQPYSFDYDPSVEFDNSTPPALAEIITRRPSRPASPPPQPPPSVPLVQADTPVNGQEPEDFEQLAAILEDEDELEELDVDENELPDLPNFLEGVCALIYNSATNLIDAREAHEIRRYLVAYGGSLLGYMDSSITHVISRDPWGSDFEDARSGNSSILFVRPNWLVACHQEAKRVDESDKRYAIGP